VTVGLAFLAANVSGLRRWLARRRLAAHPQDSPTEAASIWYDRMTRSLARRGWRKSPLQTPQEFLGVIDDPAVRARVARFTRHYEGARFGNVAEDAQRLSALYEEISAAVGS